MIDLTMVARRAGDLEPLPAERAGVGGVETLLEEDHEVVRPLPRSERPRAVEGGDPLREGSRSPVLEHRARLQPEGILAVGRLRRGLESRLNSSGSGITSRDSSPARKKRCRRMARAAICRRR